jgi:hypothetical protein
MNREPVSGLPAVRQGAGVRGAATRGAPPALRRRGVPRFVLRVDGHGPRINVSLPLLPVAMVVACAELVLYPILQAAVPYLVARHGDQEAARLIREIPAFPFSRIMGTLMRSGVPLEVSVANGQSRFHLRLG